MSVEVVMPQMGESITEGTISKWLKKVGDKIERDEPLLEISTDKVDAEVPSPQAGVLLEIRHQEGETVEVDTVVAVLGAEGEEPSAASSNGIAAETPTPEPEPVPAVPAPEPAAETPAPLNVESQPAPSAASGNATDIVMPQMGESITEGTISKWLKSVGDKVERDEPLLEISTDKVDAEVPSPVAGTLLEIVHGEGETVEVDTVLARIGAEGAVATSPAPPAKAPPEPVAEPEPEMAPEARPAPAVAVTTASGSNGHGKAQKDMTAAELRKTKSSPLVRNIAKEHDIDISRIDGSGMNGRVTKKDILAFIESGAAISPQDLMAKPVTAETPAPAVQPTAAPVAEPAKEISRPAPPAVRPSTSVGDRVEPMSVMRKKIAEHMTLSKQTSAHVSSVYEIDMTSVVKFRDRNKAAFLERYGTKLTFMPFIFQAVTAALRKFPVVNSQIAGDQIVYKGDINLGMAVALDWGLIVPVIRRADSLSLAGLAQTANDLADRARTKKLSPDEVQGGTFTITNPGVFGGLFGTPIINQPQVAILCVGTIEKRPKVMTTPEGDDYIGIRSMAYFALTYDHRIVDGADGEQFLSFVKDYLENTEFSI
jgi:2-oxoglutarate dehydrogenase E2 component (dihydrolipoamide succinyltransferase)